MHPYAQYTFDEDKDVTWLLNKLGIKHIEMHPDPIIDDISFRYDGKTIQTTKHGLAELLKKIYSDSRKQPSPDFLSRLKDETMMLESKTDKLSEFIDSPECHELDEMHRILLSMQYGHMMSYLATLKQRLILLEKK